MVHRGTARKRVGSFHRRLDGGCRHMDAIAKEIVMYGQRKKVVSDEERRELTIRRMCDTLMHRALAGDVDWTQAQPIVQALIEGGAAVATPPGTAKRDLAEERRAWFA